MQELYSKLEQIKNDIRTINPIFKDELLDLLYEYVITSLSVKNSFNKQISNIKNDHHFQKTIEDLMIRNLK